MNKRYVLPICFAAAAHGALLFGFTKSPRPIKAKEDTETRRVPFVLTTEEPPIVEIERSETAPKGQPDAPQPLRGPEPLPIEITHQQTMALPPIARVSSEDMQQWMNVPIGVSDGRISETWKDVVTRDFLDNSPRTRFQVAPIYPFEAKKSGVSGQVTVEFGVDENGLVFNPRVVSSTDRVFEEASLRAVAKWRFEPGRRDGKVVRFRMAVPLVFTLNEL